MLGVPAVELPPRTKADLVDANPALHQIVARWLRKHGKVGG